MRVGQILGSVSRRNTGVFEFACALSRSIAASGADVRVFGLRDADTDADAARWAPLRPVVARRVGPAFLELAPGLLPRVLEADLEVLHAHGLWTMISVANLAWAARTGRPYVVSIHGMLTPQALRKSSLRKRVASAAYERRRLRGAGCVHAVGAHETRALREQGVAAAVAEIPYGVDMPVLDGAAPRDRPTLLYLGRLAPLKGVESLIAGWIRARSLAPARAADWRLVIGGWGEAGYETRLRRAADGEGSVVFAGPLFGPDREAAYRTAHACVLPSLGEGMPMGVLEAWARARPVLMTDACYLPAGFEAGAALRVGEGADGVAAALVTLFAMSGADREEMGRRGRALVERLHSWPAVARQFLELYGWLAGGGPAPAAVVGR